jgi:hypothetical protein
MSLPTLVSMSAGAGAVTSLPISRARTPAGVPVINAALRAGLRIFVRALHATAATNRTRMGISATNAITRQPVPPPRVGTLTSHLAQVEVLWRRSLWRVASPVCIPAAGGGNRDERERHEQPENRAVQVRSYFDGHFSTSSIHFAPLYWLVPASAASTITSGRFNASR